MRTFKVYLRISHGKNTVVTDIRVDGMTVLMAREMASKRFPHANIVKIVEMA